MGLVASAIAAALLFAPTREASACSISGEPQPSPFVDPQVTLLFVATVTEVSQRSQGSERWWPRTWTSDVYFQVEAVARGNVTTNLRIPVEYRQCADPPEFETGARYLVVGATDSKGRHRVWPTSSELDGELPSEVPWSPPTPNPPPNTTPLVLLLVIGPPAAIAAWVVGERKGRSRSTATLTTVNG